MNNALILLNLVFLLNMIEAKLNMNYKALLQSSIDSNLENYLLKLNECNEKFCEVAVHDIRVSIRRFLTLLSMLRFITNIHLTSEISLLLKEQLRFFNPLRDIQVQLLKVQQLVYKHPVLYKYYHYLLVSEEEYIPFLKNELLAFDVNFFNKLILNLKMEFDKFFASNNENKIIPEDIACLRFNNVIARYNNASPQDVGSIHKIRLSFKKFRYTMEIIQPLKNIPTEDYLEMSNFQTLLGTIQDHTVFLRKMKEFAESQYQVSKEMFKPVEEEQFLERERHIDDFFKNFNKFYDLWKPEYLTN